MPSPENNNNIYPSDTQAQSVKPEIESKDIRAQMEQLGPQEKLNKFFEVLADTFCDNPTEWYKKFESKNLLKSGLTSERHLLKETFKLMNLIIYNGNLRDHVTQFRSAFCNLYVSNSLLSGAFFDKFNELWNKKNNESSTTAKENFVPQPQIVKTNTAQVQQETSSPVTDPQQLASQTSNFEKLQKFLDKLEISCMPFYANFWLDDLNTSTLFRENLQKPLLDFMKCVTGEIDDANINKKAEELSDALCKDFAVNDTGSITTRLNEIIQRVKDMQKSLKEKYGTDIIDSLLKVVDELGDSVVLKHVNGCNNKSCFLCNRLIRIKNHMDTDPLEAENLIHDIDASPLFKKAISKTSSKDAEAEAAKVKEELTKWKEKIKNDFIIKTANFKKEGSKVKRFAKQAVSKQELKKNTKQKNSDAKVLLDAVIEKLPCKIDELKEFKLDKIETTLRNTSSSLISFDSNNTNTLCNYNVSAKTIETIAKPLRNTAKKTTAGQRANSNSDSIVALAVLYRVLTVVKKSEENEGQIEKLFKAFAKWFNKYVSSRSAIRSPKVVKALNDTVGKMAGDGDMFKCGKLIRAKNAIKKIAKKDNNSSGDSAGTNPEIASLTDQKQDKFKHHFKKLSSRKLFSRNKKENPNA